MYKLFTTYNGLPCVIKQEGDMKLVINLSQDSEYVKEYLKWVAEGNTPEPADE